MIRLELLREVVTMAFDTLRANKLDDLIAYVDVMYGGGFGPQMERVLYERNSTKRMAVIGASESFAVVNHVEMAMGRPFTETEVNPRRPVVVLGDGPYRALFSQVDPLGKEVRVGDGRYTVVGVLGKRPSPGGFNLGQDEFAVIPYSSYARQYGMRPMRIHGQENLAVPIPLAPREHVSREEAEREVEKGMRLRHGPRLAAEG